MSPDKLFIANRGEIAARIVRTANRLRIPTIAVYTPSDALAPHVSLATEAHELEVPPGGSEASSYVDIVGLISIAKTAGATLLHPGYGFLSENAQFARSVREAGITFLGPGTEIIEKMGLKHKARLIAQEAGVDVIPGSDASRGGLVYDLKDAVSTAAQIGYPILLKASGGGGGMGMTICNNETELRAGLPATRERAKSLFHNDDVILERYYPHARHIEIQVFGDGYGKVIHMGERECSLQRRHQKVIEESPSPFLASRAGLRNKMCEAAVRLCEAIKYGSAGTVEFLVDDPSGAFFFLEINTRIQVEHGITEVSYGPLDLVELMILQGIEERASPSSPLSTTLTSLDQSRYALVPTTHSIEARIYAEDPAEDFRPSPGILQLVSFGEPYPEWLRVDTWIVTGSTITPFFDPLIAKVIVTASTRGEALERLGMVLENIRILGPPTNVAYLGALLKNSDVVAGRTTTQLLPALAYTPAALIILSPGLSSTVQDLPGRSTVLHGIPPSGAMDSNAHSISNILAGNPPDTEALEVIPAQGIEVRIKFKVHAVIGIAGGHSGTYIRVDGADIHRSWMRLTIFAGSTLEVTEKDRGTSGGLRVYISVQRGFPDIPEYLGSKSTSLGFGGYQGRSLAAGDQIRIMNGVSIPSPPVLRLPDRFIPSYPQHWILHVVSGPHDGPEFLTYEGIEKFYSTTWSVSSSSNRMGIRLSPTETDGAILWARENGGEGGSHPSNILDNAYARGAVNINGDTPVILGCEGPDMGGYVCLCAVTQSDMWKLGQLHPGCSVHFKRVSWTESVELFEDGNRQLNAIRSYMEGAEQHKMEISYSLAGTIRSKEAYQSKLHVVETGEYPTVIFRQAGDSAILIEYGDMVLDFSNRARIHALETLVADKRVDGIVGFAPCVRSTMCYYVPSVVCQNDVLSVLIDTQRQVNAQSTETVFPGRRITLPIVLDDHWNREALERYMRTTRDKAAYLPSNIEYLARNNGLETKEEALQKLVGSDWLVTGVGFYLGCPFLVPFDPRCRLVGQKMNPSRTYTPRGAIGIAGVVAAIYPVESPGGYQLYGRTIPGWQTWSRGKNFTAERPWLLRPFDQLRFVPVTESEYEQLEKDFDAGRYEFKIETCSFSLSDHEKFVATIEGEIAQYRQSQAVGVVREEARERSLFRQWEEEQRTVSKKKQEASPVDAPLGVPVTSPLSASVWKIRCKSGDEIRSADDILIVLEAMKTEINVTAGVQNIGRKVSGFGRGISEGSSVSVGDTLVVLK